MFEPIEEGVHVANLCGSPPTVVVRFGVRAMQKFEQIFVDKWLSEISVL